MKRILLLLLVLPAIIYSQWDRGLSRVKWDDLEQQVRDSIIVKVDSVAELTTREAPLGAYAYLRQISKTKPVGGGWFVVADSAYPEGGVAFDHPTKGKQWVRVEYLTMDNRTIKFNTDSLKWEVDTTNSVSSKVNVDKLLNWMEGGNFEYFYGSQKLRYWYSELQYQNYGSISYHPHIIITNFGDSHTGFTVSFREIMLDLFNKAGIGFIAFGQNNYSSPAEVTINLTAGWTNRDQNTDDKYWGIMGNSIESSNVSDSVTVVTNDNPYNMIRIWYYDGSGSITVRVNNILKGIITFGGTNTIKSKRYDLAATGDSTLSVKVNSGTVILYGVDLIDNSSVGLIVNNLTNGGSRAYEWRNHLDYFSQWYDSSQSDLVGIQLGINDFAVPISTDSVRRSLLAIINNIQTIDSDIPIITFLSNKTNSSAVVDSLRKMKNIHREIASKKNTSYFFDFDLFPDYLTAQAWGILSGDGVHPNFFGYRLKALALKRVLTSGYENYASKTNYNVFEGYNSFRAGLEIRNGSYTDNPFEISNSTGTPQIWSDGNQLYFSNLRRLYFSNSSGSLGSNFFQFQNNFGTFELWRGQDGKLVYSIGSNYQKFYGNIGFGTSSFGSSAQNVISISGSTPPTTAPTDVVQIWAEDAVGTTNKSLFLMNEDGAKGAIIHDTDQNFISIGADTTLSGYDGLAPFYHPTIGDTIWIPFKLNK